MYLCSYIVIPHYYEIILDYFIFIFILKNQIFYRKKILLNNLANFKAYLFIFIQFSQNINLFI